MIPKIIHYCWFGKGKMTPLMKKCIRSWKKYCPDYQIIEWNEDNFDVTSSEWTNEAYQEGKYAFVADYVRLRVLCEYGGVYLDTDQELIKPIECFMKHRAFLGFMEKTSVSMGLVGAEKNHPIINQLFDYYSGRHFCVNGIYDLNPNTEWATQILLENGLVQNNKYQVLNHDLHVYPQTYFCPTSCVSVEDCSSKDTVSLHHWAMTWRTDKAKKDFARVKRHQTKWYRALEKLRYAPNRLIRKVFGDSRIDSLKNKLGKK
jgi:mannosyltransferase OCH1-like enzyme